MIEIPVLVEIALLALAAFLGASLVPRAKSHSPHADIVFAHTDSHGRVQSFKNVYRSDLVQIDCGSFITKKVVRGIFGHATRVTHWGIVNGDATEYHMLLPPVNVVSGDEVVISPTFRLTPK